MNRRDFIRRFTKVSVIAVVTPVAVAKALENPEYIYHNLCTMGTIDDSNVYIVQNGDCDSVSGWGEVGPNDKLVIREYGEGFSAISKFNE